MTSKVSNNLKKPAWVYSFSNNCRTIFNRSSKSSYLNQNLILFYLVLLLLLLKSKFCITVKNKQKNTPPPKKSIKPRKKSNKEKQSIHIILSSLFLIIIQLQIIAYMYYNTSNFKIVIGNVRKFNNTTRKVHVYPLHTKST